MNPNLELTPRQRLERELSIAIQQISNDVSDNVEFTLEDKAVSTEKVVRYLMQYMPVRKDDLRFIPVLNDAFIEKYSHGILHIFKKYQEEIKVENSSLSDNNAKVLQMYRDRLYNISRNNRNLHTPLASKSSTVLSNRFFDDALFDFIFGDSQTIQITNRTNTDIEDVELFNSVKRIEKDAKRRYQEFGTLDLYLAYPFVEGQFDSEELFPIRSPLLFFPVFLKKKGVDYHLYTDETRPILINKDLIFANNRFNNMEPDLDFREFNKVSHEEFYENILNYYAMMGVVLNDQSQSKAKHKTFENAENDVDFSEYPKDELLLKRYVVLATFPIHASSIQADISEILEKKESNELIKSLLGNAKNAKFDSIHTQKDNDEYYTNATLGKFYENEIKYVSPLNYAQEKVIAESNKVNKLVVWGPPGTGKTQTIVNLIANAFARKQNVLVVSSKKVALDVLISRFGEQSKYFMYMDEPKDKRRFYSTLKRFYDEDANKDSTKKEKQKKLKKIENEIDMVLMNLKHLRDHFFKEDKQGFDIRQIYRRYIHPRNNKEDLSPEEVYTAFVKSKLNRSEVLNKIEDDFSDVSYLKSMLEYKHWLEGETSFIVSLKRNLTDSDIFLLEKIEPNFNETHDTFIRKNFLMKRITIRKFVKDHLESTNKLFNDKKSAKEFLKISLKKPSVFRWLAYDFLTIDDARTDYEKLHEDKKNYLSVFDSLFRDDLEENYLHNNHTYLINAFYTHYVELLEKKNKKIARVFRDYSKQIKHLDELIIRKRRAVRDYFQARVQENLKSLHNCKKSTEIKQTIFSNKKPPVKKFMQQYWKELTDAIDVWVMTPEAVSESMPLNKGMFDLVIFDEASQMHVENAIPALYRSEAAVIAGDAKQLRPSVFGQANNAVKEMYYDDDDALVNLAMDAESLLDLARFKYKEVVLNFHYRSNYEELIAFSNALFYKDKLFISPDKTLPDKPPIEYHRVPEGVWKDRMNKPEARKIMKLLQKIIFEKCSEETIGIITFNTAQRELIEDLIEETIQKGDPVAKVLKRELNRRSDLEEKSLFVKNIENVQGDERDIIIFSLGYAKNDNGKFVRNFGALNNQGGENRLNVAITRARKKIYFVASLVPSQFDVSDLESRGPIILKKYMEYCYYISSKNRQKAYEVLKDVTGLKAGDKTLEYSYPMIEAMKVKLSQSGLSVKTDIGSSSKIFDLVVIDPVSKNEIGIICDVNANVYTDQVRNYFYHHEKYLEINNWKVYRVFSRNWWRNPDSEIKNIRTLLDDSSSGEVADLI